MADAHPDLLAQLAPAILRGLLQALSHDDADARHIAAINLGRMGVAVLPDLAPVLVSDNPVARQAAAAALGHLGLTPADVIPTLCLLCHTDDSSFRLQALRGLWEIAPRWPALLPDDAAHWLLADLRAQLPQVAGIFRAALAAPASLPRLLAADGLWRLERDRSGVAAVRAILQREGDPHHELARQCLTLMGEHVEAEERPCAAPFADLAAHWLDAPDGEAETEEPPAATASPLETILPDLLQGLNAASDFDQFTALAHVRILWYLGYRPQILADAVRAILCGSAGPRDFAAVVLGWMQRGANGTADALIAALADEAPSVRAAAVEGVGEFRPPLHAAIPQLLPLVEDSDPKTRWKVVGLLSDMAPRELAALRTGASIPTLCAELGDKEPAVRLRALVALARPACCRLDVVEALLASAARDSESRIRRAAFDTASALGPGVLPLLLDRLRHPDLDIRRAAVEMLGHLGPRAASATAALLQLIQDSSANCYLEAFHALARFGPQAIPVVLAARGDLRGNEMAQLLNRLAIPPELLRAPLSHPDPAVRKCILWAVYLRATDTRSGNEATTRAASHPELLALVVPLLTDADASVRVEAVQALRAVLGARAEVGPPSDGSSYFDRALDDPAPEVRAEALKNLGLVALPGLRDRFIGWLTGEDPARREAALAGLGALKLAALPAVPAVIRLLREPTDLASEAATALERIGGPATVAAVLPLLEDQALRLLLLDRFFRHLPDEEFRLAAPRVAELLSDPDVEVVGEAATVLLRAGAVAAPALPLLRAFLRQPAGPAEAIRAILWSLERIGPTAAEALPEVLAVARDDARCAEAALAVAAKLGASSESLAALRVTVAFPEDPEDHLAPLRTQVQRDPTNPELRRRYLASLEAGYDLEGELYGLDGLLPLDRDVIFTLLDYTRNGRRKVRETAESCLHRAIAAEIGYWLAQAQAADPRLRRRAATALGQLEPTEASRAAVRALLRDEAVRVRRAAVDALARLARADQANPFANAVASLHAAQATLEAARADRDAWIAERAHRALVELGLPHRADQPPRDPSSSEWLEAIEEELERPQRRRDHPR